MASYGQFCPVAKAMEILDERWTMLVLRELVAGSTRFNEIRRGVPKMSPALLSKRLRSLVKAGLVERHGTGQHVSYTLSPSGAELTDVIVAIGVWGVRWIPALGDQDYDPHLLMWDMSRTIPTEEWPPGRTTLALRFTDVPERQQRWWLVVRDGEVDVCDADPGFEPAAEVTTELRTLVRIWRGETPWEQALRDGAVTIDGLSMARRQVPRWLGRSTVAQLAFAR